jgi:hypothetical protein
MNGNGRCHRFDNFCGNGRRVHVHTLGVPGTATQEGGTDCRGFQVRQLRGAGAYKSNVRHLERPGAQGSLVQVRL